MGSGGALIRTEVSTLGNSHLSLSSSSSCRCFLYLPPALCGAAGLLAPGPHPDQRGCHGGGLPPHLWSHLALLYQVSGFLKVFWIWRCHCGFTHLVLPRANPPQNCCVISELVSPTGLEAPARGKLQGETEPLPQGGAGSGLQRRMPLSIVSHSEILHLHLWFPRLFLVVPFQWMEGKWVLNKYVMC